MKGPTCTQKAPHVHIRPIKCQVCPNTSISILNNSINTYSNANTNQVIQPYLNQLIVIWKSNKPAGKKQSSICIHFLGKFNKAIFVICKLHLPSLRTYW